MTDQVSRAVQLTNQRGLHARASAAFIREAKQFASEVYVTFDGRTVNMASIMELLTLGARCGQTIEISAEGEDAEAALNTLCQLVERKFDEEE
ncbi:MAG: HPr family phosphocarrier protein [Hyphomonadaceae bacterium]